jgi:hypothetical protein
MFTVTASRLLKDARMGQARKPCIQTTICPDCGLELRLTYDARGFKIDYDMRAWRRMCTRVPLGDAAWCLIERDGTHQQPTGGEWGGNLHIDC